MSGRSDGDDPLPSASMRCLRPLTLRLRWRHPVTVETVYVARHLGRHVAIEQIRANQIALPLSRFTPAPTISRDDPYQIALSERQADNTDTCAFSGVPAATSGSA